MWAMPAFIARAQASTSGTKMKFSRNLMPTSAIPAISPSSITSSASVPASSCRACELVDHVVLALDEGRGDRPASRGGSRRTS